MNFLSRILYPTLAAEPTPYVAPPAANDLSAAEKLFAQLIIEDAKAGRDPADSQAAFRALRGAA